MIDEDGDWIEPDPDALHPAPVWFDDEAEQMERRQVAGDTEQEEDDMENVTELPAHVAWTPAGVQCQAGRVLDAWRAGGCDGPAPVLSLSGIACPALVLVDGAETCAELVAEVNAAALAAWQAASGGDGYPDNLMTDEEWEATFGPAS